MPEETMVHDAELDEVLGMDNEGMDEGDMEDEEEEVGDNEDEE